MSMYATDDPPLRLKLLMSAVIMSVVLAHHLNSNANTPGP